MSHDCGLKADRHQASSSGPRVTALRLMEVFLLVAYRQFWLFLPFRKKSKPGVRCVCCVECVCVVSVYVCCGVCVCLHTVAKVPFTFMT